MAVVGDELVDRRTIEIIKESLGEQRRGLENECDRASEKLVDSVCKEEIKDVAVEMIHE